MALPDIRIHCRKFGIRRPRNKYTNVTESFFLLQEKKEKGFKNKDAQVSHDLIPGKETYHTKEFDSNIYKIISITFHNQKIFVQKKELFEGRKISIRIVGALCVPCCKG